MGRRGPKKGTGGRPKKSIAEKMLEGKPVKIVKLPEGIKVEGNDIPPIKDYMTAEQKNGIELQAKEIYEETYAWLAERGCDKLIFGQLVDQYAMAVARWIQCQTAISEYGMLSKHPTTGAACTSPFVTMEQTYQKEANQCWYQIYQIVKENSTTLSENSNSNLMERLLSG